MMTATCAADPLQPAGAEVADPTVVAAATERDSARSEMIAAQQLPSARDVPLDETVIVIGGCGFLGSYIVDQLVKQPLCNVVVLDVRTTKPSWIKKNPETSRVTYEQADITNFDALCALLAKHRPASVVHTASPVHNLGAEIYERINVHGTKNVIDACKRNHVSRLVYTSSAGVVFKGDDLINVDESQPLPKVHMDAYNHSKAHAESLVLNADCRTLRTCALRIAAIFGPGDRQLIPGMVAVLERGQTSFQLGNNLNLFDFTYIENAAWAHILALKCLKSDTLSKSVAGEAFFITNGEVIYFWDFPRAVWAKLGHYCERPWILSRSVGYYLAAAVEYACKFIGKEPGFTRYRVQYSCANRYFNIEKARSCLQYKPIVSLEDGISKSLDWLENEKAIKSEKKKV